MVGSALGSGAVVGALELGAGSAVTLGVGLGAGAVLDGRGATVGAMTRGARLGAVSAATGAALGSCVGSAAGSDGAMVAGAGSNGCPGVCGTGTVAIRTAVAAMGAPTTSDHIAVTSSVRRSPNRFASRVNQPGRMGGMVGGRDRVTLSTLTYRALRTGSGHLSR